MTLNDTIQTKIAALEAEAITIRTDFEQRASTVAAELDSLKERAAALGPWLHSEMEEAEDAIRAFFAKIKA